MSKGHFLRRLCGAAAAAALGFAVSASVAPAQAGKLAGSRTSPAQTARTVVAKATPNPVRPRAIRDHRLSCTRFVPKPGTCTGPGRPPYRTKRASAC